MTLEGGFQRKIWQLYFINKSPLLTPVAANSAFLQKTFLRERQAYGERVGCWGSVMCTDWEWTNKAPWFSPLKKKMGSWGCFGRKSTFQSDFPRLNQSEGGLNAR